MRKFICLTAISLCAVSGLLLGCKATDEVPGAPPRAQQTARTTTTPAVIAPQRPATSEEGEARVRRITVAELQEALGKKEVVVVDVRGENDYNTGHIKDAISVPDGNVDKHLDELPKDKLIVTYCA